MRHRRLSQLLDQVQKPLLSFAFSRTLRDQLTRDSTEPFENVLSQRISERRKLSKPIHPNTETIGLTASRAKAVTSTAWLPTNDLLWYELFSTCNSFSTSSKFLTRGPSFLFRLLSFSSLSISSICKLKTYLTLHIFWSSKHFVCQLFECFWSFHTNFLVSEWYLCLKRCFLKDIGQYLFLEPFEEMFETRIKNSSYFFFFFRVFQEQFVVCAIHTFNGFCDICYLLLKKFDIRLTCNKFVKFFTVQCFVLHTKLASHFNIKKVASELHHFEEFEVRSQRYM